MSAKNHWSLDYFEVISMGGGISLIREKHIAPWMRCNIWHIKGRNQDLLVDSGMGVVPLKPTIAALAGRDVTAISSHCHFDHMGGAYEFDCHLAHAADAEVYADPTGYNTLSDDFVSAEVFTSLPHNDWDWRNYRIKPAPLTGYLDDGDVLDLGDRSFHVLHLPGHAPGAISLYDPKEKTLFSGDVIYQGGLIDFAYHSNTEIYEQSLRRLRELPVSVVHGGHEGSFCQERMIEIIDGFLVGGQRLPQDWANAT